MEMDRLTYGLEFLYKFYLLCGLMLVQLGFLVRWQQARTDNVVWPKATLTVESLT